MGRKKLLILALICATGASSLVYRFLKSATGGGGLGPIDSKTNRRH